MVGRGNRAPKTQIAVLTVEWAEPETLTTPVLCPRPVSPQ